MPLLESLENSRSGIVPCHAFWHFRRCFNAVVLRLFRCSIRCTQTGNEGVLNVLWRICGRTGKRLLPCEVLKLFKPLGGLFCVRVFPEERPCALILFGERVDEICVRFAVVSVEFERRGVAVVDGCAAAGIVGVPAPDKIVEGADGVAGVSAVGAAAGVADTVASGMCYSS